MNRGLRLAGIASVFAIACATPEQLRADLEIALRALEPYVEDERVKAWIDVAKEAFEATPGPDVSERMDALRPDVLAALQASGVDERDAVLILAGVEIIVQRLTS